MLTSLVTALVVTAAPADWLAVAEKQCFEMQYPKCLDSLERAWVREGNSREQVIRILELTGVTAAQVKQNARSQEGLRRLFLIDFAHTFTGRFAPRVNTQILEAKSWVGQVRPLAWSAAPAELAGEHVRAVSIRITNDPMNLGTLVRFHTRADGGEWKVNEVTVENSAARLDVDAGELEWWAELLTGNRGVLMPAMGSEASPQRERATKAPVVAKTVPTDDVAKKPGPVAAVENLKQPAPSAGPRFRPAAWVMTVTGALAVGAGVTFGVMSSSARQQLMMPVLDSAGVVQNQTQAEAYATNARMQRDAILAMALSIGGGVVLATGVTLFIVGSVVGVSVPL
ncbi:MAG: hypothetical protein QM817_31750 [Archangium sp.]